MFSLWAQVPPVIAHFEFEGPLNEGDVGQLSCLVAKGDPPLHVTWSFHGLQLNNDLGISTVRLGTRTSILTIDSVSSKHSGTYTCTARNAAGTVQHSADLIVNGNLCQGDISSSCDDGKPCHLPLCSATHHCPVHVWPRCPECWRKCSDHMLRVQRRWTSSDSLDILWAGNFITHGNLNHSCWEASQHAHDQSCSSWAQWELHMYCPQWRGICKPHCWIDC